MSHQVSSAIAGFVTLEARLAAGGREPEVAPSWRLPELTYRVTGAIRRAAAGGVWQGWLVVGPAPPP